MTANLRHMHGSFFYQKIICLFAEDQQYGMKHKTNKIHVKQTLKKKKFNTEELCGNGKK